MKNIWNNEEAEKCNGDLLKLRVYTSRLLGREEDLVLHGGGNTSVKIRETNIFGEEEDILYVKGSGWDLATIEEAGFAPVKLKTLFQMAELEELNDVDMVKFQRTAMTDPGAPNPSVEAILHAIIPYTFVDHTHADAVVTISNTPKGEERIKELYGDTMLIVPYVMPGFVLAKEIYNLTHYIDWNKIEGIILLNHGVFTFHDDPRESYDKMIDIVTRAEDYLNSNATDQLPAADKGIINPMQIAELRLSISNVWNTPVLAQVDNSRANTAFSNLPDLDSIMNRGPLTPDHIIRTKRTPLILSEDHNKDVSSYASGYKKYFDEFNTGDLVSLDHAPRWALWPGHGTVTFGTNLKNNRIIRDISQHTMKSIFQAEQMGGWHALSRGDLFEMEYWVLEQQKLKKGSSAKSMQGKIALVTGAASGIGKACVEGLVREGAVVAALDINPAIKECFGQEEVLGIECDVTNGDQLDNAIERTVVQFGGIDMLISNAGTFPESLTLDEMDDEVWQKSLEVNLTSHQKLIKSTRPYLGLGIDPAIAIIGSKNVPAPGRGAAAYSVAKAGLAQLARIAALELGSEGIRVNTLHPHAVFDTGIWTEEMLQSRANHYGMTVEEYKANNLLGVELTSVDVAKMAIELLGPVFSKTTGAQIAIDGGSERTI